MKKSLKDYLPTKKFSRILGIGLGIFCIIFGIIYYTNNSTRYNKKTTLKTSPEELVNRDTDQDGVADWQEALWGTDPKNPATYNNISDKEYVLVRQKEIDEKQGYSEGETLTTETDKFSQELFATLVSLKQSNNLNEQTVSELSQKIESNVTLKKNLPDTYTANNLTIIKNPSKKSREQFLSAYTKTLASYGNKDLGKELDIIITALNSEDEFVFQDLKPIASSYEDLAKSLSKIPTPEDVTADYLRVINNLSKIGISINSLSEVSNDALVGMIGLGQYRIYSDSLDEDISKFKLYFKNNGII